jgi:hypothetical protein
VGAKLTWVLSGFDVSEAIDVLRGRAIVVVVDKIEMLVYVRGCLRLCMKEVVADKTREMQVGIIDG